MRKNNRRTRSIISVSTVYIIRTNMKGIKDPAGQASGTAATWPLPPKCLGIFLCFVMPAYNTHPENITREALVSHAVVQIYPSLVDTRGSLYGLAWQGGGTRIIS